MLPYLTLPKSIAKKIEGKNLIFDTLGESGAGVYLLDNAVNRLYCLLHMEEDAEKLRYYILLDELF